ncbi:MAG: flagellar basal body P-ring formation protein FlgA [Rhodospirillales bacterium]|nr:flagellar basal body P-ring formation protein FlgA [Rhodospirillales bacterium]
MQAAGIVIAMAMTLAGAGFALAQNIDLPVPRATIYPGDTISSDQLTDRAFIASSVTRSSVHDDRQALVGKVARRTLLPGAPVQVNAVRDPYLVNQNKSSLVVFQNTGLTITTQAIALENGGVGDVVKLRNPDSGVIIQGIVEPDGTVRLGVP